MSYKFQTPNLVVEVDGMLLHPVNEREVLDALGPHLAKMIRKRALAGVSSSGGRLPSPKDAGTPSNPNGRAFFRSGQLAGGITHYLKNRWERTGGSAETLGGRRAIVKVQRWTLLISSVGKRDLDGGHAARTKALRKRNKEKRAGIVVAHFLSGRPVDLPAMRKAMRAVRTRTGTTNPAVAGILSVSPVDKGGRKGGRGIYRVIELSRSENNFAQNFLKHRIELALVKPQTRSR